MNDLRMAALPDSSAISANTGIGAPVRRKEDFRLLTGAGCYSADTVEPNQSYAFMLRSPHAHANVTSIDCREALAMRGVLAVLTGQDFENDGLKWLPHTPLPFAPPDISLEGRGGISPQLTKHFPIQAKIIRYIGEIVAVVVATSLDAAKDAADAIVTDYEMLPAVIEARDALCSDAPRLWADIPANTCVDVPVGNAEETEAAFAKARYVVKIDTWIPRVTAVPMEPRAALATFDSGLGCYCLRAGAGGVVRLRRDLAFALDVPEDRVRVVSRDIGGNFGSKNATSPEYPLLLWAARRVGRPVKWICDRTEAFLSDYQGRDLLVVAELALDAKGNFLALRGDNISNVGAYVASLVPLTKGVETMTSVYRIPHAYFRARAVLTNTPPTYPYRSAGRPEAMFVIERLIDMAAAECGLDRLELRRQNLIPRGAPYANPLGITYDGGHFADTMDKAARLASWSTIALRKTASCRHGKLRGIGIANYIEVTSGAPREKAVVTVDPAGFIEMKIGTLSSGQGHETSFAQLLCEWLHVPFDSVRLVTGDTDQISVGGGSHSGRSMRFAGIVVGKAAAQIVERATRIAAVLFECANEDVIFRDGSFTKPNTDRSIHLFEIAAAAQTDLVPTNLQGPLSGTSDETVKQAGFPYGSQVCEVEIDPDTGAISLVAAVAVDDVGRAVNPLILHGQTHGGFVQGAGQALLERCHYDRHSGQLLSASFMDYAMPRASFLPNIISDLSEIPAPGNVLGIRAGGEGGTTPALGAICNAVVDALAGHGVTHCELPITAERVWRAIQAATVKD
jgi:carbon-monoxide dehydrogenase large subunit